jgi:hypothetical protein
MATSAASLAEHAFVPGEGTITSVFTSREEARNAIPALAAAGVQSNEVEVVTGARHEPKNVESPGFKQDSPGVEAFDEILHVLSESFSDDDKIYVEFDRALAAGGALLSLSMTGRKEHLSEVADLLRSRGARAIYYWGALATEQL